MKIKEWAEEDRPREKMLLKGIAVSYTHLTLPTNMPV